MIYYGSNPVSGVAGNGGSIVDVPDDVNMVCLRGQYASSLQLLDENAQLLAYAIPCASCVSNQVCFSISLSEGVNPPKVFVPSYCTYTFGLMVQDLQL